MNSSTETNIAAYSPQNPKFELLIIGGFIGYEEGRMVPFVGTSVPMSRFEMDITSYRTSEIYSLTVPPSTKTSGCLLKQYYKKDAKRLWSFHSLRFYNDGLYPINPLRVRDHPIVSEDSLLECASFLLRTFAYLEIDRSKIGDLLVKVKNDEKLKRKLKLSADGFNTFSELKPLINKKGSHTTIFNTLSELEEKEEVDFFKDDRKNKEKTEANSARCWEERILFKDKET